MFGTTSIIFSFWTCMDCTESRTNDNAFKILFKKGCFNIRENSLKTNACQLVALKKGMLIQNSRESFENKKWLVVQAIKITIRIENLCAAGFPISMWLQDITTSCTIRWHIQRGVYQLFCLKCQRLLALDSLILYLGKYNLLLHFKQ